jgi:Flp pilus assembly pilin Flp
MRTGSMLQRLRRDVGGQAMAEYGLAIAVIGTVGAVAAMVISTNVRIIWIRVLQTIILAVLGIGA